MAINFIFDLSIADMDIIVFVPENSVIESVTPPFKAFSTANEFLETEHKSPFFKIRYAGMSDVVPANDNTYHITTQLRLNEVDRADLLILPALAGDIETALASNAAAIPHIRRLYDKGVQVASLCAGAFLLAEAGLVNGKKCSTHWAYYDAFRKRYPEVEVVDGTIITDEGTVYSSGGANSIWNLILYLIEKFAGRDIAVLVSKFLAIDLDRNSQAAFTIFIGQKRHNDTEIKKVQELMEKNFADRITINELAARVNISRRTFERRFKLATNNNPNEYLQRVRVEAAKKLFEVTRKNVSEVMYEVGYVDTKSFREVFKKITGLTPVEYRNKFNKNKAPLDMAAIIE